jgi:hypothetical protein
MNNDFVDGVYIGKTKNLKPGNGQCLDQGPVAIGADL